MSDDDILTQRLFARTDALRIGAASKQILVIVLLITTAVAWANWAVLDEQIRAPGKVIVSSRSQVVQSVDGGVLKKLHVREGDTVSQGDLIAELDPVRFQASNDEIVARVIGLKANIQRLEAELNRTTLKFSADVRKYPDIVKSQQRLHWRRAERMQEEISAIERSLALAQEELRSLERLQQTGDAALTEVLQARRQVNELRGQRDNTRNAGRQEAQTELAASRSDLEEAQQQLAQRREALEATKIHAPMSGVVKNVRITTIGGVLRAGDELLQIVPSDDPMIIEVKVVSKDVAFVRLGLKANVKLDAYDYTVYGSMKGHVTYISPDTFVDPEATRDEEPTYRVHIQIDEMPEDQKKPIEVIPGMVATAEIITGERTVAQYLLKPLRRVGSEALVER